MRKIKLQMQTTLNGYVAGPNGEMDWLTWDWDDELKDYVAGITQRVDLIILGRVLAEGFIPVWKQRLDDGDTEEFSAKMVNTPKVVFSTTLTESPWENTTVANGNTADEIQKLKQQEGGDIIVYGGARLTSTLIKHNLIDEYHIFVNPAVIPDGLPIFSDVESRLNLKLVEARSFACGINVLVYNPQRG